MTNISEIPFQLIYFFALFFKMHLNFIMKSMKFDFFILHLNDQILKSALFWIVEEDKGFTVKQTKEKRLNWERLIMKSCVR